MSTSTQWRGNFSKSALCTGSRGIVVEGTVKDTRVHSVFISGASSNPADQADSLPTRYFVIVLSPVHCVYERLFDKNDDEVDYQWNMGRKGLKNYHEPKMIAPLELVKRLGHGAKEPIPDELLEISLKKHLHPHQENVFEFWIDQNVAGSKEITAGNELRLTTIRDSVFVDAFRVLNAKSSDALTGGWTDALLQHQDAENKYINLEHETEVDDDEWSD